MESKFIIKLNKVSCMFPRGNASENECPKELDVLNM